VRIADAPCRGMTARPMAQPPQNVHACNGRLALRMTIPFAISIHGAAVTYFAECRASMLFLNYFYETTYMKIVLYYTYLQYGDPAPIILLSLSCRQVNTEPDKTGEYHENLYRERTAQSADGGACSRNAGASFGAASAQQLYPAQPIRFMAAP